MDNEMRQLLRDEIQDEMKYLKEMSVGTDEYKVTVEGLVKLVDRAIEIDKLEAEALERAEKQKYAEEAAEIERELKERQVKVAELAAEFERDLKTKQNESANAVTEFENSLKAKQAESEDKDRLIRNIIAVTGIVVPSLITIWGTLKSLKFEETGSVTTIMGRGFINKLLPKTK
ncbi:MAG: hypothetical protein J6Q84_07255 [Kiritimatiellae bacterium]|nr:hypothetical protein [Kiritimatiellia bacterium]